MESSLLGRDLGKDGSMIVGGISLGDFDVKNEEERMKAFLQMSAGWEEDGRGSSNAGEKGICKMLFNHLIALTGKF